MKGFEKFILIVFSIIIIVMAIGMILISTEMIQVKDILVKSTDFLVENKIAVLITGSIFTLLGLIGLFASDNTESVRAGLAIKKESGTVYITKDTFESIIEAVTRNYAELKNVRVEIQIAEEGVVANLYAMILPDTVVPTLTAKLQDDIKESVQKQTTVEIKEANIKIRGVYLEPIRK